MSGNCSAFAGGYQPAGRDGNYRNGQQLEVSLSRGNETCQLPAKVMFSKGTTVGLSFIDLNLRQQFELAAANLPRRYLGFGFPGGRGWLNHHLLHCGSQYDRLARHSANSRAQRLMK